MKLERTRKGYPALWERGGAASRTGCVRLIAGAEGEKLCPVYIKRGGHLSNSEHALFIVEPGTTIIDAYQRHGDFDITVSRITRIYEEEDELYAELQVLATFLRGEWDREPEAYMPAIEAAKAKATDYHCRNAYWVASEA